MKISNLFALILFCSFFGLHCMERDSSDGSRGSIHELRLSDPDQDLKKGDEQVTVVLRRRSSGNVTAASSLKPPATMVRKLSLGRISNSSSPRSEPPLRQRVNKKPTLPLLQRMDSRLSAVSLPAKLSPHLIADEQSGSGASSYRTPRGIDEPEIYFAADHDPKIILLSIIDSIRGRDADAALATHEFTDPEIVAKFASLPNEKLLCISQNSAMPDSIKQHLLAAGVTLYRIKRDKPLKSTLGVFGNTGVMGSYIPSEQTEAPNSLSDSSDDFFVDDLIVFNTSHSVSVIFEQLRYILAHSDEVQSESTAAAAAAGGD